MRTPLPLALVVPGALLMCALGATFDPARAQDPEKTPPTATSPTKSGDMNTTPTPVGMSVGRFLIGDPAPDVNLHDQHDRRFHLTQERRVKPWLLVFVRFPRETAEVETAAEGLSALGMGAVIIAPFGREQQRPFVARPKLPLLLDRASVTARTFGLYDPVTSNPRQGAFLIDQRGRIVWMISGGIPSAPELVRMTREALEAKGELPAGAGADRLD